MELKEIIQDVLNEFSTKEQERLRQAEMAQPAQQTGLAGQEPHLQQPQAQYLQQAPHLQEIQQPQAPQALAQGGQDLMGYAPIDLSSAPAQDLSPAQDPSPNRLSADLSAAHNKQPNGADLKPYATFGAAQDLSSSRAASEQTQSLEAGQNSVKEQLIKDLALLARPAPAPTSPTHKSQNDEALFLQELKSRLLVLFEGLRSKDLVFVEEKVDLIINFLELVLAKIEHRLDTLNAER
ncbi:MAG: CiaD-like domain-containing protein [Helicobacteraceae bacterium]